MNTDQMSHYMLKNLPSTLNIINFGLYASTNQGKSSHDE